MFNCIYLIKESIKTESSYSSTYASTCLLGLRIDMLTAAAATATATIAATTAAAATAGQTGSTSLYYLPLDLSLSAAERETKPETLFIYTLS